MSLILLLKHSMSSRWWEAIDRRLNQDDIRSVCLLVLIIYSIVLAISFTTQRSGRTVFGPQLGADFAAYYVAGAIFNHVAPGRIYDRDLHRAIYQEVFPTAPSGEELPYVNAPFFILPFIALARLHYAWAYLCWLLISLGLFISGFNLIWKSLVGMPASARHTALLLGLSFMPFLIECLAGGQTSAFGFFSFALAINCEYRGRKIMSGGALALCSYKPTLLLLALPMLVITRRFSTIVGFLIGGLLLATTSSLIVGLQGCLGYLKMLLLFADSSTSASSGLKSWKYVDVNSFFRPFLNQQAYLRWFFVALAFLVVLPLLFKFWRRRCRENESNQDLVWAVTLTWTLVLNIYLGIYDTTLVVLSVLLTTHVLCRGVNNLHVELKPDYKLTILLLYLIPWITQPIARLTGFQLYTVILALFGGYQLAQQRR